MGRQFSGGGYAVTINDDRSIIVQPGDWLSKYSMAVYGDFDHIKSFKEKVNGGFRDVPNPDLIRVGQTLYHPGPLPGEKPGSAPPQAPQEDQIQSAHVAKFFQWVLDNFVKCDWSVKGNAGGDLSLSFFTVQYAMLNIVHNSTAVSTWFHALAAGATLGFPDDVSVGGSFSTTDFPGAGTILRSPIYRELTIDDFRHSFVVVEGGASFFLGGQVTLLIFGMGFAPSRILFHLDKFFRTGDVSQLGILFYSALPAGVIVMSGANASIPGAAVAARVGMMYDRHYWGV